jgi:hypothetical protein
MGIQWLWYILDSRHYQYLLLIDLNAELSENLVNDGLVTVH